MRLVFSVIVSEIVKQLLTAPEKQRRTGSENYLAPEENETGIP